MEKVIITQLGPYLRTIRESKGIRQGFIAKKLGKSQSWLWAVETGRKKNLDVRDLAAIAELLNIDASALITRYLFNDLSNEVTDHAQQPAS